MMRVCARYRECWRCGQSAVRSSQRAVFCVDPAEAREEIQGEQIQHRAIRQRGVWACGIAGVGMIRQRHGKQRCCCLSAYNGAHYNCSLPCGGAGRIIVQEGVVCALSFHADCTFLCRYIKFYKQERHTVQAKE